MVLITLFSGLVFAQSAEKSNDIVHKLDFEDFELTGEVKKPTGDLIQERKDAEFNPLIVLRETFQLEMQDSVNEIK